MLVRFIFVFVLMAICLSPAEAGIGMMTATQKNNGSSPIDICFWYPSNNFTVATENPAHYDLEDVRNVDPCDVTGTTDTNVATNNGKVLLMILRNESDCDVTNYLAYARRSSAAGLVLVANKSQPVNSSYSLDVFAVTKQLSLLEKLNFTTEVDVQFLTAEDSMFHGGMVVLWSLAVFCVAVGSYTGPYRAIALKNNEPRILQTESIATGNPQEVKLNVVAIVLMVAFLSTVLLSLYFFYKYLVYVFIGLFVIASAQATYHIVHQAFCYRLDRVSPRIRSVGLNQILLGVFCLTIPIVWFVFRKHSFAWILQDILGVCFCIHLIQTVRMPSLKVCTILMSLLFVYDIFFVFITPLFTKNGQSVMVEVATGGGSGEELPVLFKTPTFDRATIISPCLETQYSVLGYGDVIIPAFVVCYVHARDIINGDSKKPYFFAAVFGYGLGLIITFIGLVLMQTGQPALLYLVPSTLIPIYIVALIKKEVKVLWNPSSATNL